MEKYIQADLIAALVRIFPQFAAEWALEVEGDEFPSTSLHSVYMALLPVISNFRPSERQWRSFADHLSEAVAAGGDRENAADTCVLEHLHQVGLNKLLAPLLSEQARTYVYG
jgi:hypothetical protein